jgi:hypothetical protein
MLKNSMIGMLFIAALLVTLSTKAPYVAAGSEAQADQYDCMHACTDCQKACESLPAGSAVSNCQRACTAAAAGCCAGNGKGAPSGMTCTCT